MYHGLYKEFENRLFGLVIAFYPSEREKIDALFVVGFAYGAFSEIEKSRVNEGNFAILFSFKKIPYIMQDDNIWVSRYSDVESTTKYSNT